MEREEDFFAVWEPRIGRAGARQLRRTARAALVLTPLALVFALVASVTLGGAGAANKLTGLAALAGGLLAVMGLLRSRALLADALSEAFGEQFSAAQLPPMRVRAFDTWCARHGVPSTADIAPR